MDCNCPDDGILADVPVENCSFDMKQIQRLIFATQGKVIWDSESGGGAGDGVPSSALTAQVDTLADWQARRSAVDDTRVVPTPLIGGDPVIEAGDAITEGGDDNSTLNGIEEVTGVGASKFSALFKSITPAQEKALKAIACKPVEVYFILEGGRIACKKVGATKRRRGFKIQSMFVSDRNNGGYGTKDSNAISFSLPAGWSEDLTIVTPADFNPLYDI